MEKNDDAQTKPRLLLHACCGICAAWPIEFLQHDWDLTVYFYNPNIKGDYAQRLDAMRKLFPDVVEDHDDWGDWTAGLENEPERGRRCDKCFKLRLGKAAQKARELGIKNFTTTITISPHKSFEQVARIGAQMEGFLPMDFKKNNGFLNTNRIARELGLYRQSHCGCACSMV